MENPRLAPIPLTEECAWLTNQMNCMSAALRDAYNKTSNHRRRRYEARYDEARDDLIEHIARRQTSVITNAPLPDELVPANTDHSSAALPLTFGVEIAFILSAHREQTTSISRVRLASCSWELPKIPETRTYPEAQAMGRR